MKGHANVIRFPTQETCPECDAPLRAATAKEIAAGLKDSDRRVRERFANVDQENPAGCWVLICDKCGRTPLEIPIERAPGETMEPGDDDDDEIELV